MYTLEHRNYKMVVGHFLSVTKTTWVKRTRYYYTFHFHTTDWYVPDCGWGLVGVGAGAGAGGRETF